MYQDPSKFRYSRITGKLETGFLGEISHILHKICKVFGLYVFVGGYQSHAKAKAIFNALDFQTKQIEKSNPRIKVSDTIFNYIMAKLTETGEAKPFLNWWNQSVHKTVDIDVTSSSPPSLEYLDSAIAMDLKNAVSDFINRGAKYYEYSAENPDDLEASRIQSEPLNRAIREGLLPVAKAVLDQLKGDQIISTESYQQFLCEKLELAILSSQAQIAIEIVKAGADPNVYYPFTVNTPLTMAASKEGMESLIEHLVDQGARVDRTDMLGRPPIHLMISSQQNSTPPCNLRKESIEQNVIELKFGRTALQEAVRAKKEHLAIILVEEGAEIDTKDKEGLTVDRYPEFEEMKELQAVITAQKTIKG